MNCMWKKYYLLGMKWILKDILIDLRDGYNNKHNNEYAYNNGGAKEEASGNRLRSEHLRPSTRGGVLGEARFSIPDMPFFEDGGDVVVFDDIAEEPIPLKISAGFSRAINHYNIGSTPTLRVAPNATRRMIECGKRTELP